PGHRDPHSFPTRRSSDLGHARCIACHGSGTPLRLQPLAPGATTWSDEDARKNFEAVRRVVVPGSVPKSRLLVHPLTEEAGGEIRSEEHTSELQSRENLVC